MARPPKNEADRRAHRSSDSESEQSEETAAEQGPETEQPRVQEQLGNQVVQEMLASDPSSSRATLDTLRSNKQEIAGGGLTHGGADDAADAGPLTEAQLTSSWNPGLPKAEVRPNFTEPMPDDTLPPPDSEWLASLPPPGTPPEALLATLQPSEASLVCSFAPWADVLDVFVGRCPVGRVGAHLIRSLPSCLQDPSADVVITRSRTGAIALYLLADALHESDAVEMAPLVATCLELRLGARPVRDFFREAQSAGGVPRSADLARGVLGDESPPSPTSHPDPSWLATETLAALLGFSDPRVALPSPDDSPSAPSDDPLGLDHVIDAFTKPPGASEPYRPYLLATEAIAALTTRDRVQVAAVAVWVARVLQRRGLPPQSAQLLRGLETIDAETDKLLRLLVEIAEAARRHLVPARGLSNGIKRAASRLERIQRLAVRLLASAVTAAHPQLPSTQKPSGAPTDPLHDALVIGRPQDGRAWLETAPVPTASIAAALLSVHGDQPALAELTHAAEAERDRRPFLAGALQICATAAAAFIDPASALERTQQGLRRAEDDVHGLAVAEAALTGLSAMVRLDRSQHTDVLRQQAGTITSSLGARAASRLLASWTPPDQAGL